MDAKDSLEPFSEPPFVVLVWFSVPLDLGFGAMSSVRARTARRPSSFAIGSSPPAPPGLFLLADFLASGASTIRVADMAVAIRVRLFQSSHVPRLAESVSRKNLIII